MESFLRPVGALSRVVRGVRASTQEKPCNGCFPACLTSTGLAAIHGRFTISEPILDWYRGLNCAWVFRDTPLRTSLGVLPDGIAFSYGEKQTPNTATMSSLPVLQCRLPGPHLGALPKAAGPFLVSRRWQNSGDLVRVINSSKDLHNTFFSFLFIY